MPTTIEMFETIQNWRRWHGADEDARIAESEGHHTRAQERRAARDQLNGDPLQALHAAHALIESLKATQWDMITDARLQGVSWDEIAHAVRQPTEAARNEYTSLVNYMIDHPPAEISSDLLDRYRAAL